MCLAVLGLFMFALLKRPLLHKWPRASLACNSFHGKRNHRKELPQTKEHRKTGENKTPETNQRTKMTSFVQKLWSSHVKTLCQNHHISTCHFLSFFSFGSEKGRGLQRVGRLPTLGDGDQAIGVAWGKRNATAAVRRCPSMYSWSQNSCDVSKKQGIGSKIYKGLHNLSHF